MIGIHHEALKFVSNVPQHLHGYFILGKRESEGQITLLAFIGNALVDQVSQIQVTIDNHSVVQFVPA
ncbi:hypothetical protein D3C78_1773970 [compost metagenome]